MAYRQSNPFSRRTSSPFNRDKVAKPGAISKIKAISRRSSSPLNAYPTAGTFAGSLEEAERLHAPGPNEEYVDIGTEGAPVYDMQTRLGDTPSFGANLVEGEYQSPGGGEGSNYMYRNDDIRHPLGRAGTAGGSDVSNLTGADYWTGVREKPVQPMSSERPNPSMMPVEGAGFSWNTENGRRSRFPGQGRIDSDIYANINPNDQWDSLPTVNPFTGSSIHTSGGDWNRPGGGESTIGIKNQRGFASDYYTGSNLGKNTPWQYASQRFGDDSGPNLVQEGMTAYGAQSPAVYPFFSTEQGQTVPINQTRNQRGQGGILTKNFGNTNREVKNLQNFEDAYSTYINRNTMDPNELYSYDQKNPNVNFDFSERFKTELPEVLAGGQPVMYGAQGWRGRDFAQPDLYDRENSMFKNALTSSRFTGGGVDEDGYMLNRDIDNPVDIMTQRYNNKLMTQDEADKYLARLRATTFSGKL